MQQLNGLNKLLSGKVVGTCAVELGTVLHASLQELCTCKIGWVMHSQTS